jgi:two-component system cell cycle sensor histidine kinase/response regulator CckA
MHNPDVIRSLLTADCSLIIERDGTVSWCDPAAADLLGLEQGSVPGWDFPEKCGLFFPDSSTPLRFEDFPLGRIFAGAALDELEICVRGPQTDGEDVWLSVTAAPVFSASADDVIAALLVCHCITDRKKALQGLEDAHAALQALVQASPLAVVAMERDGRVNFWNRAAEKVFGWTEAEVHGHPLPFVPEERKDEFRRMRAQDLKGEIVLNREIRRLRKDGSSIDLTVSRAPIRDRTGALTGTICLYVDVTERNRLEDHLRRSARLDSLGVLAGGLAHDFNNLLTSILGNASLAIEDAVPGSEQEHALQAIMGEVDRAAALTRQMLSCAGHGKICVERVNLTSLIQQMLPLVHSCIGTRTVLSVELARNLPALEADSQQFREVLVNLMLNARESIEATHRDGMIWLRTGMAPPDEWGARCFIQVRDNGCGMDRATQDRIFDPFFSTKFTGRGLGLAAVMGIVRAHKGSIQVASAPGEGSSFLVLLPVLSADVEACVDACEPETLLSSAGVNGHITLTGVS